MTDKEMKIWKYMLWAISLSSTALLAIGLALDIHALAWVGFSISVIGHTILVIGAKFATECLDQLNRLFDEVFPE